MDVDLKERVLPAPSRGADATGARSPVDVDQHLWRRGLPLSSLGHGLLIALSWLAFALGPQRANPGNPNVARLLVAQDDPATVELSEELIEPPLEPELPEPDPQPELVERPFDPTTELPPDPPPPEALDWLPPHDPLAELEPWEAPPPALPIATVAAEPPRPLEPRLRFDQGEPEVIEGPRPRYPRQALRLGWEGTVRLRINVAADGRVVDVHVIQSSGRVVLDEAALEAFRRWVFRARHPGEPEVRSFEKPFTFQIL